MPLSALAPSLRPLTPCTGLLPGGLRRPPMPQRAWLVFPRVRVFPRSGPPRARTPKGVRSRRARARARKRGGGAQRVAGRALRALRPDPGGKRGVFAGRGEWRLWGVQSGMRGRPLQTRTSWALEPRRANGLPRPALASRSGSESLAGPGWVEWGGAEADLGASCCPRIKVPALEAVRFHPVPDVNDHP